MNYVNHYKIDLQHFYVFYYIFITLFTYTNMSKDLSDKYYKNNNEILQQKLGENIKVFLMNKKRKKQQ